MTLHELVELLNKYRGKRQLVEAWDEDADRRLVQANLNSHYYAKVKQEACRRREDCGWVRVTYDGSVPLSDLLHSLEKLLGVPLPVVRSDRRSAVVNCPSEDSKTTLLDWDKGSYKGAKFGTQPVIYEMTGDEILDFVMRTLQNEEDFEVYETCNDLRTRGRDR